MNSEAFSSQEAAPPKVRGAVGEQMVALEGLTHSYGEREALKGVSLGVATGEVFGLLGPNGSGKSTLIKILSTLLTPSGGQALIAGLDVAKNPAGVRRSLGVAFQSPSLDNKLTVEENIRFQGYLFGLSGKSLGKRIDDLLARFSLSDRRKEKVQTLSGGLKRRVELAKTLLHKPRVLLLDEPSSGLDPHARLEFWRVLADLQKEETLTVLVATHLMEEAERCDRVALLDTGNLVALDTPNTLKAEQGGDILTIETDDAQDLAPLFSKTLGVPASVQEGLIRMEGTDGLGLMQKLLSVHGKQVQAVKLGRPTLEDVFLAKTGRTLANTEDQT